MIRPAAFICDRFNGCSGGFRVMNGQYQQRVSARAGLRGQGGSDKQEWKD
jgi:hypothetical protein